MPGFWKRALVYMGIAPSSEEDEGNEYLVKARTEGRASAVEEIPKGKVIPFQLNKIHLIEPKNFNDAKQIGDKFKRNIPIIMNLQAVEQELAKRLVDFTSGLSYGRSGRIEIVADRVFLLTPPNISVSAEDISRLQESDFFNQF